MGIGDKPMSDLTSEKACKKCETLKPVSGFKRIDSQGKQSVYLICNSCAERERIALDNRYKFLDTLTVKKLEQKPKWRVVYYSFP
jgi:RNase P subunit RPR2